MNIIQCLNRFNFYNQFVFYNNINSITNMELNLFINKRKCFLLLNI